MKRIWIGLVALCLLVVLCGCTSRADFEDTATPSTEKNSTTSTTQTKPTLSQKIKFPITIQVTESIRVRKGPGIQFEAIGGTAKGDTWTATAREGDWFKIDHPTEPLAYINAQYVSVTK